MKNNLRKLFVLTVFCMAFGSAVSVFGQNKVASYKPISVSDSEVQTAANFAVEKKIAETKWELTLGGISSAEMQTIAGTNYRLCIQITAQRPDDDEDSATGYVKTIIHKNLKGEFTITSWELDNCAEL